MGNCVTMNHLSLVLVFATLFCFSFSDNYCHFKVCCDQNFSSSIDEVSVSTARVRQTLQQGKCLTHLSMNLDQDTNDIKKFSLNLGGNTHTDTFRGGILGGTCSIEPLTGNSFDTGTYISSASSTPFVITHTSSGDTSTCYPIFFNALF